MTRAIFSAITPLHHDTFRSALEAENLPTDDLLEQDRFFFRLADDDGTIGFIGLQGSGPDRLLRSLVVLPQHKRRGHGSLLVAQVEAFARQSGARRLHLLTTAAADFFRTRAYKAVDRTSAPALISATTQFASLCPASAAYLVKELA